MTSTTTPAATPADAADSTTDAGATETASSSTADSGQQINLNTADKTKLQELSGIGDKKADQIIAYRQAHGQFKNIEELKEVPGFGEKTFANLKSSICV
ncbi:helix-hairpin-helix domain-containing protein [Lentilactobacillus parabuchneri]